MSVKDVLKSIDKFTDKNLSTSMFFKKIPRSEGENIVQKVTGYKLNETTKALAYGIGGLYVANDIRTNANQRSSTGEIHGGELANSINSTISPVLQRDLNAYSKGDDNITENLSDTQDAVSAEIAMAMFELSGQGGI